MSYTQKDCQQPTQKSCPNRKRRERYYTIYQVPKRIDLILFLAERRERGKKKLKAITCHHWNVSNIYITDEFHII
jgi:hypothetical protein